MQSNRFVIFWRPKDLQLTGFLVEKVPKPKWQAGVDIYPIVFKSDLKSSLSGSPSTISTRAPISPTRTLPSGVFQLCRVSAIGFCVFGFGSIRVPVG